MFLVKETDTYLAYTRILYHHFHKKQIKNIIVLSFEALTDFYFLNRKYGFEIPSVIQELVNDGIKYPLAYSPTESTLPFAASFSSGLMVSQHGIGDYSKSADQCFNQTLNNMGIKGIKSIRQGKYFDIELVENNVEEGRNIAENICKKLLTNSVIEDYKIL